MKQQVSVRYSGRKKTFFLLTILLIMIVVAGLLECILRLGHVYQTGFERNEGRYKSYYHSPYRTHYPTLSQQYTVCSTPEFTYAVSINSNGFRDREWAVAKTTKNRIMVLGDSFAEGVGAPGDSTWPVLLENILNTDTTIAEVFNAGVSGSDPVFQHRLFQHKLSAFSPDLLLMSINFSDIHEIITRGGEERFLSDGRVGFRRGPDWEPLYRYSYLFRFVLHAILGYDFSLLSAADYAQQSQLAIQEICRQAIRLHTFCGQSNTRFAVIIHPYLDPYDAFLQRQDILLRVESMLQQRGVAVINLFSPFREKVNKVNYKQYAWPVDKHFNGQGYALFAGYVAAAIRQDRLLLLPPEK